MATLSPATRNVPSQPAVESAPAHSPLYRVGRFILIILALLLSLIIAVPIGLLFVATSVPWMISLVLVVVYIVIAIGLFRFAHTLPLKGLAFIGMITLSVLAVVASQLMAATPAITDSHGQPISNSIASLERVNLGGTEQWITIRGQDIHNPVLLFLAGGPGGSELVMTRRYLSELEAHFVVVNWDQPGAGKSYNAVDISTLTPERYVSDAYELTQLLRERFQQEKIYVLGESWGSILGIWLVQQHPDLFHAYISTGQMVKTTEDDVMGYEFALNYLTQAGRTADVAALRLNGSPPFTGDDRAMRFSTLGSVLNEYMHVNAQGEGGRPNLLFELAACPRIWSD